MNWQVGVRESNWIFHSPRAVTKLQYLARLKKSNGDDIPCAYIINPNYMLIAGNKRSHGRIRKFFENDKRRISFSFLTNYEAIYTTTPSINKII